MINILLLQVLGISLLATCTLELLNWYFIYRKSEFVELNDRVKALTKKFERFEEELTGKNSEKKKNQVERQLKEAQQALSMKKFKSTIIIGIFMLFSISQLNKLYANVPVAKLPFVPFRLISGITHRGLEGEDFTECSFMFIYILAGMFFRTIIQKVCGFEGAKQNFNMMMPTK